MRAGHLESLILYVSDLAGARAFYADALGLPVLFEDEIVVVVGTNRAGSSCTAMIGATMSGASSLLVRARAALRCALRWTTRTLVSKTLAPWALRSSGRRRRQPGAGSSSWLILTAALSCSRR